MKALYMLLLLLINSPLSAQPAKQTKNHYCRLAISNSHTAKPFGKFSSLIYKDFHPGGELGYGITKTKAHHQWLAELNLNYLFHRWVQHNVALSVSGGYRKLIASSWGAFAKLGAGFQLSVPTEKVFSISADGIKNNGHIIRPQFLASLSFGADKKINDHGVAVFVEYQQKIQAPFINEYVPLLPYNTLMLGISFPIRQ